MAKLELSSMIGGGDDVIDDDEQKEGKTEERSDEGGMGEEESSIDLRNYLREDILEAVDECLNAWEKTEVSVCEVVDPLHRCVVCTLPHGTCQHTKEWLEIRDKQSILDQLPKDNVDLAMGDIVDVLKQAPIVLDSADGESLPPVLSTLRWETLSPQPADELTGEKIDLSSPGPRAGHTMVQLDGSGSLWQDTKLLVVFGGVSSASGEPLHLDSSLTRGGQNGAGRSSGTRHSARKKQQTLSYHADVHVFHLGLTTWHHPDTVGDLPEGRYGHVSLAIADELMWMFGGRLKGGRQEGGTYVLDMQTMRWERTNIINQDGPSPEPRVWSAAAKVRERVLLFGGTDVRSGRIFDDVWTWDISARRWTEQIVVGTPPLPRYGHALVASPAGQVLIFGGCCVNIAAEEGLPEDYDRIQQRVRIAANNVSRAYELEEAEFTAGVYASCAELSKPMSTYQYNCAENSGPTVQKIYKDLSRGQAKWAAAIAARERDTTVQEDQLRTALHEQAASSYWAWLKSTHPLEHLDVMFLDADSMIWEANAPQRWSAPAARMHFSAVTICDKVVVWGGCLPTAKRMQAAENGVYVFDTVSRKWSRPLGLRHPEGIRPKMDAALGQVRRATRILFEAKQRAMTIGAPGGRTMQVVQAEAVMEVNRWRVQQLVNEIRNAVPSPQSRAAHAGCAVGHRVVYLGGWGAEGETKGELLVLDVEQPSQRERRLEEEFHQRLERERQMREEVEAEALRRTARQENMRKELEVSREVAENVEMAAEDVRSAIPELTVSPTPKLRCANSTTLWLTWDRPTVDAVGSLPDDRIEYTLYMRGGFREWEEGDQVLVEYLSRAARKAAAASKACMATVVGASSMAHSVSSWGDELPGGGSMIISVANGQNSDEDDDGENISKKQPTAEERKPRLLPAVITDASTGGGLYDIRWDDGERERSVHRYRIHRQIPPTLPWTVIYRGDECGYAVEGVIPAAVIERERSFPYEVSADFSLQTQGTEIPRVKLSMHSPVVTFSTRYEGQGPCLDGREVGGGGVISPAILKTRLATARVLDDSISSAGISHARDACGIHPLHGQHTGIGQGRLFL